MSKKISVIISVYNRVELFKKSLDSVLEQTYTNIEIIVVDDGSTEENVEEVVNNVREVLETVETSPAETPSSSPSTSPMRRGNRRGVRDIIFFRQENKGAPAARNKGFELSQGEYVIFWDADIKGKPEMLERLKRQLDNHPEASFAYCNYHFGFKKMSGKVFDSEALKKQNYIHSTSLIRRGDVITWDETLKRFQDWDLWLSMSRQDKIGVWIDEYLFHIVAEGTMSEWLPKIAYKKPWKYLPGIRKRVETYERAREIIRKKHHI